MGWWHGSPVVERLLLLEPRENVRSRYCSSLPASERGFHDPPLVQKQDTHAPLLAPASEAAERSAECGQKHKNVWNCLGLCTQYSFFSLWWNLLVLRHGS